MTTADPPDATPASRREDGDGDGDRDRDRDGDGDGDRDGERPPVIEVEHVSKRFALEDSLLDRLAGTRTFVQAVTDVSLTVYEGETLGLVGESGSGKSTLANVIAGLYTPTSGAVRFDGEPVGHATHRPRELLSDVGMVFQNPRASLNPRMTVEDVIAEPLRTQGWDEQRREARVAELIDLVELSEIHRGRYPHELSGGQAQRVAIARAVALDPRVLILDEPVSALDVSVQAKILNLLIDLQADLGLTYLLIAHDLSVVKHMADRVAVMYLGRIMEVASPDQVFENPTHPYTEALLSAIPSVDPTAKTDRRIILEGDVPSPVNPPSGCVFHTRCPVVTPPADWSGDQPAFEAAFAFRHSVLSGDIDPGAVRKRLQVQEEPTDDDAVAARIVDEEVPCDLAALPADASTHVEEAAAALVAGDEDRARDIVREAFPSPCEQEVPRTVETEAGHTVACHRSDPDVIGEQIDAGRDRL